MCLCLPTKSCNHPETQQKEGPKGSEGPPPYAWKCQPTWGVGMGVWTLEVGSVWWSLVAASEPALSDKPTRSVETGAPCSITPSLPDLPACRHELMGVGMPSLFLCPPRSGVPGVTFVCPAFDRVPVRVDKAWEPKNKASSWLVCGMRIDTCILHFAKRMLLRREMRARGVGDRQRGAV